LWYKALRLFFGLFRIGAVRGHMRSTKGAVKGLALCNGSHGFLVLQLRVMSVRAEARPTGGFLMVALLAGARNDAVGIRRALLEDEAGQEVLNRWHAQLDMRRAGRSPFFRGVCRARIAARKAWA